VRFIEKNRNKPFCLYMPHECPHYPYQGRNDKADRAIGNAKPQSGSRKDRDAAYAQMIEAMDESVGRIVRTLRELGLEEQTFVFFCSDNGPTGPGSAGPLRGRKGSLWEGGHRVPAIAYRPRHIAPGSISDATTMTMDIFATIAAMAKTETSDRLQLDGIDMSPVLMENGTLPQRTLFWLYNSQRAMRDGPWKLIVTKEQQGLYNLDEDPGEADNLIEAEPARVARMKEEFKAWEQDVTAGVERRA
jgi:arylsulfatase A-like enzyme